MLSMRIDSLIANLVRQELSDKDYSSDKALHFHLDLRMSYYQPDGKTYSDSCGLHLLYHSHKGYDSITVFSAVMGSPFARIKEVKEWDHEVTHDSCWRDISVFSRIYFAMAANINSKLLEDGCNEVAPITMSECNNFSTFSDAFNWVNVCITKDPNDSANYRRLIKIL